MTGLQIARKATHNTAIGQDQSRLRAGLAFVLPASGTALVLAAAVLTLSYLNRRAKGDVPRAVVSLIAGISLVDALFLAGAERLDASTAAAGHEIPTGIVTDVCLMAFRPTRPTCIVALAGGGTLGQCAMRFSLTHPLAVIATIFTRTVDERNVGQSRAGPRHDKPCNASNVRYWR
jgi:hypothetical protein